MQPGSFSRFSGADILEGENAVANRYCDLLAQYQISGYFTHPIYPQMKRALVEHGWSSIHSVEELQTKLQEKPVGDPENLFDFQYGFFSLQPDAILRGDPYRFPQILFLDRAILPYCQNKYLTNRFLDQIEEMRKLRPVWRVYPKGVSRELMEQICSDIPGEILVIKPIQATMGRGVIILEKKDLEATLNYIFRSPEEVLLRDLERSYSHYAVDESDFFIVEEFIPSDPINLAGDTYDCTMRVIVVLSYHQKEMSLRYLSQYWYSPKYPLNPAYNLIQSHKAKGTHVFPVAPEIFERVKQQLSPALLETYRQTLRACLN